MKEIYRQQGALATTTTMKINGLVLMHYFAVIPSYSRNVILVTYATTDLEGAPLK